MKLPTGHFFKRSKIFWCQWKHKSFPYARSLKTANKDQAEKRFEILMTQVRSAILENRHAEEFGNGHEEKIKEPTNDILLESAWQRYLQSVERPDTGDKTLRQYQIQFGIFVRWMNERHPKIKTISEVKKNVAREFASELAEKACPSTFNKYMMLLLRVFRILNKELKTSENPWNDITRKRKKRNNRRGFTPEELKLIFKHAEGEMLTLCLIAYHSGMRMCDCCLLKWGSVDLRNREIRIVPRKTENTSGEQAIIPIHDELYDHLIKLNSHDGKYVCPEIANRYGENGETRSQISSRFRKLLLACGFVSVMERSNGMRKSSEITFHSFRYSFVSGCAEAGIDRASVQALVGWSNSEMERVYTNVSKDHLREAIGKRRSILNSAEDNEETSMESGVEIQGMTDDELEQMIVGLQAALKKRKAG